MTDQERNDDASVAEQAGRPTAREIADLLRDYRQMIADADGWAHRIPTEQVSAWEARKADLLARITRHNDASRECAQTHKRDRGEPGLDRPL
jgi:hypothetical protein